MLQIPKDNFGHHIFFTDRASSFSPAPGLPTDRTSRNTVPPSLNRLSLIPDTPKGRQRPRSYTDTMKALYAIAIAVMLFRTHALDPDGLQLADADMQEIWDTELIL